MAYKTDGVSIHVDNATQDDGSQLIFTKGYYVPPKELISTMVELNKVKIEESKAAKKYYDAMTKLVQKSQVGEENNNETNGIREWNKKFMNDVGQVSDKESAGALESRARMARMANDALSLATGQPPEGYFIR